MLYYILNTIIVLVGLGIAFPLLWLGIAESIRQYRQKEAIEVSEFNNKKV